MYTEGNTGFLVRVKTSHISEVGYSANGDKDVGSGEPVCGGGDEGDLLPVIPAIKSDMSQSSLSASLLLQSPLLLSSIRRDSGDN